MEKEITILQSLENVWKALTEPARMKEWYFNISDEKSKYFAKANFIAGWEDILNGLKEHLEK